MVDSLSELFADHTVETSFTVARLPAIDMHSQDTISNSIDRIAELSSDDSRTSTRSALNNIISEAPNWLPFAAESYEISANIRDFVMAPVVIIPSDLPNRNKTAFPYLELSSFNPEAGMLSYRTFSGKPTHIEHINRDITKAKGVVMDVAMHRMAGRLGNLWKVVSLCGFDRTKDAALANDILTGRRDSYSMGAYVKEYSCSICGCRTKPGMGKALPCGDEHVNSKPGSAFKTFNVGGKNIVGHFNAHGITGFEVSSVSVPAWASAATKHDRTLRY